MFQCKTLTSLHKDSSINIDWVEVKETVIEVGIIFKVNSPLVQDNANID